MPHKDFIILGELIETEVDLPYHFDGDMKMMGTIQEVTIERDTMIYKDDEHMTCLLLKDRVEKWEKIEFVKEPSHKKIQ